MKPREERKRRKVPQNIGQLDRRKVLPPILKPDSGRRQVPISVPPPEATKQRHSARTRAPGCHAERLQEPLEVVVGRPEGRLGAVDHVLHSVVVRVSLPLGIVEERLDAEDLPVRLV